MIRIQASIQTVSCLICNSHPANEGDFRFRFRATRVVKAGHLECAPGFCSSLPVSAGTGFAWWGAATRIRCVTAFCLGPLELTHRDRLVPIR